MFLTGSKDDVNRTNRTNYVYVVSCPDAGWAGPGEVGGVWGRDTLGTQIFVRYNEVSLSQGLPLYFR